MLERRKGERIACYEVAFVALDEHTWVPVIICDQTEMGARMAMLNTDSVPETFLLRWQGSDTAQVCKTIWRTSEVIGAWFDGEAAHHCEPTGVEPQRIAVPRSFAA